MTKQQVWDALLGEGWDPNEGDHELFFSDRLDLDVADLGELGGVSVPGVLDELRSRPKLQVYLFRYGVCFESTEVDDCNDQDHNPCWARWGTEDCSRDFNKKTRTHSVQWAFG